MTIQFTNNASTTLASGITAIATSLTVATGAGALFPTPSGAAFFYCTLQNVAGTLREIVKVTARTTDTFTIVRGQDGTTGQIFSTSDKVELRVTAADLNNFGQLDTANTWASGQTFVAPVLGTPASGTLTNATGYTYANLTGTVPTWNQNTSGTAAGLSATLVIASGGTNSTATPTAGGIGYGTGTAHAYTAVGTAGQALISANGSAPAFGTLPIAGGGTNSTATPTAGGAVYGTGTAHAITSAGTTGQVLTSQGAGAPIWAAAGGGGAMNYKYQLFTASGTWTAPTGVTSAIVTVIGAGGGGNYGYSNQGGYGGSARAYVTVSAGTGYTITIGTGGTGSVSSAGTGGSSSFSTLVTATGGTGGGNSCGVYGSNGVGTGGTFGSSTIGTFNGAFPFPNVLMGKTSGTTASTVWTSTLGFVPGSPGAGLNNIGNQAVGGVNGVVLVEWIG